MVRKWYDNLKKLLPLLVNLVKWVVLVLEKCDVNVERGESEREIAKEVLSLLGNVERKICYG